MAILTISGSLRRHSSNTALLRHYANLTMVDARPFDISSLPLFSPDLEGDATPPSVLAFAQAVQDADGIVISCPEYARAIPGGMKNAIDWLVSRNEIIGKPIALLHASHRGDDMLANLRAVLSTVSDTFSTEIFERFELVDKSADDIEYALVKSEAQTRLVAFAASFNHQIAMTQATQSS